MNPEPSSVEEAVELFLEQRRRGEPVDARAFAARHARLGPDLGAALDALLALDSAASDADLDAFTVPDRVGPYRVVREIGRGGMGVVLEAIEEPLGRRVALKVLPPQFLNSAAARRRFQREAELASRLDHPSIATVYGTGVEESRPWIAMRYVEGPTLAHAIAAARAEQATCARIPAQDSSDRNAPLVIAACIAKVARALQAAHAQGVVHRDVKPSNILLTAVGEPVLVDFGLAIPEDADGHSLTRTGDTAGTPAYIAPEILAGERQRPDAQGDVYALGVTLYECLALRRPFEAPTPLALYRAILSNDPADLRSLRRNVPHDLAVVTHTALERDRARRYASAAALADDLERVLRAEPVLARPPSIAYRARKFVQRNRAVTVAGTVIVLLLAVGLVAALVARDRALDLKNRAEHAEGVSGERAQALALELEANREMLALQSSWLRAEALDVTGRDVRLADVLDRAAEALDERAATHPRTQYELRSALARAYYSLKLYDAALAQTELARAAFALTDQGDLASMEMVERMACVAEALGGQKADALDRAQRFLQQAVDRGASAEVGAALWRITLGEMLLHHLRYDEAERELRAGIAVLAAAGPADRPELLDARVLLARALRKQRRVADAEGEIEVLLADCERLLGGEHFTTTLVKKELCELRIVQRRFEEARAIYEDLIGSYERRFGPDSEAALGMVSGLAGVVRELRDLRGSEDLARRAAEGTRRLLGMSHPLTEVRWGRWGNALIAIGNADEGLERLQESLRSRADRLGADHPDTLEVQASLGMALLRLKRNERALAVLQECRQSYLRSLGPAHPATLSCMNSLASAHFGLGRYDLAAELFGDILCTQSAHLDRHAPDVLLTLGNLAAATADAQESACLHGDLHDRLRAVYGDASPNAWTYAEGLLLSLGRIGAHAQASALAASAIAALRDSPRTSPERLCKLMLLRARAAEHAGLGAYARACWEEVGRFAFEALGEDSDLRSSVEEEFGSALIEAGEAAPGLGMLECALERRPPSDAGRAKLSARIAEVRGQDP